LLMTGLLVAQALPLDCVELVLRSDRLVVESENDSFAFVESWLAAQASLSAGDRQSVFSRLMGSLRFHHMTPDFLACVVGESELMKASGAVTSVLRLALCHVTCLGSLRRLRDTDMAWALGSPTRVPLAPGPGPREHVLEGRVALKACLGLQQPGQAFTQFLGLANGFPIELRVCREAVAEAPGGVTFGAYVKFFGMGPEGQVARGIGGGFGPPALGCLVDYKIRAVATAQPEYVHDWERALFTAPGSSWWGW
jgi:hypothetical protein